MGQFTTSFLMNRYRFTPRVETLHYSDHFREMRVQVLGGKRFMSRPYDVMAAGHLCLDIIPRFYDTGARQISEILRPGKLVNVAEAAVSTGGPVSNTGINLKTLGSKVIFCARCGDDDLGAVTVATLKRNGNADGLHIAKGAASAYTLAIAPPGIDRIFIHNPGTNDTFGPEDLDPQLISQCRLFHFGYPPLMRRMYESGGEELRQVLKTAKDAGATVSLDMSLPDPDSASGKVSWRTILEKILPYVDIFVPSIEECFFMLHSEEFLEMKRTHKNAELVDQISPARYGEIADECLAMGTKMVTLKAAHRGFYFRTAAKERFAEMGEARPGDPDNWSNRELWAEAFVIEKMASATGSGDSAIAGLLTGFLRGLSIERALRCATVVGMQNLRALDAVSGIRPWEETEPMLDLEMPTLSAHLDGSGWTYSKELRLWTGPHDRK